MEEYVFAFSLITEGTTEKVLQPLKSIYNQNLCFIFWLAKLARWFSIRILLFGSMELDQ